MMPTPPLSMPEAMHTDEARRPSLVCVRSAEWRGCFIKGDPLHEWIERGGRPDEIPVSPESIVRDGSRSRCSRIVRLDEKTPLCDPLYMKAYRRRPGFKASVKRLVGWHLPSWVWRMSWRLLDAGVPVPRPAGYLVPRGLVAHQTPFYWAQWIDGAVSAKVLARDPARRHRVAEDVRFAEQCARILARLHNAGVYHRDMNWGNLVLDVSDHVWLVDLDAAHRRPASAHSATMRDLARFLMDAEEYEISEVWRKRFMERYVELRHVALYDLDRQVRSTIHNFYKRRTKKHQRRAQRRAKGR